MNPGRLLQHFDQIAEAPDAVPRLRRFILDLAVRGKLVLQDPNDEPASVLLKRIGAEKTKYVRIGQIRNRKADVFASEVSNPFLIPSRWLWARFGQLVEFSAGKTPSRHDSSFWNTGDYPWISISDMTEGGLVVATTKETVSQKAKIAVFKGDPTPAGTLLMSFKLTIGRVSRLAVPAFHNEAIISIYPHIQELDPYLFRFLPLFSMSGSTKNAIKGATLNRESLGSLPIPLPPLAEQHRIVAKVDELMALCDELEAAQTKREKRRNRLVAATLHGLNNGDESGEPGSRATFEESARFYFNNLPRLTTRPEHIQQLRQTILNLAVRGKLVPQVPNDEPASRLLERVDVWRAEGIQGKLLRAPRKLLNKIEFNETPYTLPIGWAWVRLGDLIYIQSGDGLTAANMKDGNIPVYGGNGINGYHDVFNVADPTIVIGRVGYYCGSVHVTPEKAWVTDNVFITKFCSQEICLEFLVLLLKGTNLKENENATAQPVISGSKIYPIVVGIPPLAEQHRIVAKLDELITLFDEFEAGLIATATTRCQLLEAMLHEALSGQPKIRQESFQ